MPTSTNSSQMTSGKSFEYALTMQFDEKLKKITNVRIIENSSFEVARDCFNQTSDIQKSEYLLSASFAVNFLMDLEPRLANDIEKDDVLQLEILQDSQGESGDVRDILAIRAVQKWEIGVSAKNNHNAVKHSRLSNDIDFGQKWLGTESSDQYFNEVSAIFNELKRFKEDSGGTKLWSELGDYHQSVYLPILNAFIKELTSQYEKDPSKVARRLASYLVGNKDYYKVIKLKSSVEIYAYNLNGTLNLPSVSAKPKYITPLVLLPDKILNIRLKADSDTTAIVELNNGWGLSFRIHNASSRVEPSLKFDIQLLESPKNLYKNTLNLIETN